MSLRTKLILLFTAAILLCVGLVAWIATVRMRRAFDATHAERTTALVEQFRVEFQHRGTQVISDLDEITRRDATVRMAIESAKPDADYAPYVLEAAGMATSQRLDFLEFVTQDGIIISSAHWPVRFGYREDRLAKYVDWSNDGTFLDRVETSDGPVLGLIAVRPIHVAETTVYVVGGVRLDRKFLASLSMPSGTRVMLYRSVTPGFDPSALEQASGSVPDGQQLGPLMRNMLLQPREMSQVVWWPGAGSETVQAIPLMGHNGELMGALLVGTSLHDLLQLELRLRKIAFAVAGIGIVASLLLGIWIAARITRPVERLAEAASEVASGNWDTHVEVKGSGEVAQLAEAFNKMTSELVEQRERLVQTERVAAWRELARRLAHELKNPLFPLQITIENLVRARQASPEMFEEIFQESTATLLAELNNLKAIVGRFSDFAKMPTPQLQSVQLNEAAERAVRTYQAQFTAEGRPPIAVKLQLSESSPSVEADPELLHRALSNLVLNAIDAMPEGGTLTVRTSQMEGHARIEVLDTGMGIAKEECERLFTPYYTTKQHGTGLGLAIVQSVVSDHHGKISVESEPGRGTTFRIDLPLHTASAATEARGASVQ